MLRVLLIILSAALLSACPGGQTVDAGGLPIFRNPVTRAFAPVFCDHATRCCAQSQGDCELEAGRALFLLGDFAPEVDAGGITVDSTAVQQCREELATTPCNMPMVLLSVPACRRAIVGHRKVGEACLGYVGCEAGLACVLGRCEAVAGPGGSCDAGAALNCLSGICITPGCGEELLCLAGRCTPTAQVGQACAPTGRECAPYASFCDCAQPATGCVDGGVCAPLRPMAAGCLRPPQCASGWCASGACAPGTIGNFRCN